MKYTQAGANERMTTPPSRPASRRATPHRPGEEGLALVVARVRDAEDLRHAYGHRRPKTGVTFPPARCQSMGPLLTPPRSPPACDGAAEQDRKTAGNCPDLRRAYYVGIAEGVAALYTAGFTLYMVTIIEIYSVKPGLPAGCSTSHGRARGARPLTAEQGRTKIVQGWPNLRDLAQHFDWKSLLEP
jgi:hypothetical protein